MHHDPEHTENAPRALVAHVVDLGVGQVISADVVPDIPVSPYHERICPGVLAFGVDVPMHDEGLRAYIRFFGEHADIWGAARFFLILLYGFFLQDIATVAGYFERSIDKEFVTLASEP